MPESKQRPRQNQEGVPARAASFWRVRGIGSSLGRQEKYMLNLLYSLRFSRKIPSAELLTLGNPERAGGDSEWDEILRNRETLWSLIDRKHVKPLPLEYVEITERGVDALCEVDESVARMEKADRPRARSRLLQEGAGTEEAEFLTNMLHTTAYDRRLLWMFGQEFRVDAPQWATGYSDAMLIRFSLMHSVKLVSFVDACREDVSHAAEFLRCCGGEVTAYRLNRDGSHLLSLSAGAMGKKFLMKGSEVGS